MLQAARPAGVQGALVDSLQIPDVSPGHSR